MASEEPGQRGIARAVARRIPTSAKDRAIVAMRQLGFEHVKHHERLYRTSFDPVNHVDLEEDFLPLHAQCAPYTVTTIERMYALYQAMRYVAGAGIPGDFVECGVYRGGSSMLAALCAGAFGPEDMRFWLYDTFTGMTEPTPEDGKMAHDIWKESEREDHNEWVYAPLDEVRANLDSTGLAPERLELVQGPVEETVPAQMPERISVLRLDTDWYDSTKHEMEHLFPLLQPGGVLICDDFGFWEGARQAVEEYLDQTGTHLLLARVDDTGGRIAVKAGR
jgi:O-methyltransferase